MIQDELHRIQREIRQLEKVLGFQPLKGSVVPEMVKCGKPSCRSCRHGPYNYLHFYDRMSGKVKRKYLGKAVAQAIKMSRADLIDRIQALREKEKVLGQEVKLRLHPKNRKDPNVCSDPLDVGCRDEGTHLSILIRGKTYNVCEKCWERMADGDYEW